MLDELLAVTTPKSSSTDVAIAAADLSDILCLSQALASAGSLRLFLVVTAVDSGLEHVGTKSLYSSSLTHSASDCSIVSLELLFTDEASFPSGRFEERYFMILSLSLDFLRCFSAIFLVARLSGPLIIIVLRVR